MSYIGIRKKVCDTKDRGEAELRNTFWLVSSDHGIQKTNETIIGDVIDTFKNTTSAVIPEFAGKVELRQLPVTGFHTQKFHQSIMSFHVMSMYFADQCPRKLQRQNEKKNQYLSHCLSQYCLLWLGNFTAHKKFTEQITQKWTSTGQK